MVFPPDPMARKLRSEALGNCLRSVLSHRMYPYTGRIGVGVVASSIQRYDSSWRPPQLPRRSMRRAEAGMVARAGPHATTPMAATAHRLDALAVDVHVGIAVTMPDPGVGRS